MENKRTFQQKILDAKEKIRLRYNIEDRKAFVFCYIMIGLPFLSFLVFWLYVNIDSILLSFQDYQGNFTWENFNKVFSAFTHDTDHLGNEGVGIMLGRSLLVWFLGKLVVIPSILSTYILYKKIPGHYIFRTIYMVPGVLGGVVWTMIMKQLVGVGGPIMTIAQDLGIEIAPHILNTGLLYSDETAFTTLMVLQLLPGFFGFNFVVSGAFSRIPEDLFEVGRLDGVGFIREFFTISIPLIWGTLVVMITGWFASLFLSDNGSFLYTNGKYGTACMGYYMFILQKGIADEGGNPGLLGYPAALGLCFTIITVPTVLIGRRIMESFYVDVAY